jgi:cytochrome b involved in lipid metabolism
MAGVVYNVTAFLKDHPGGSSIVLPHLGTDISEVFEDEDYHVHRSDFPMPEIKLVRLDIHMHA